jgi:hypothetical protein
MPTADQPASGQFSTYQFFSNGDYEPVAEWVDAKTAMGTAVSLIHSLGAKIGTTERVIITDGDDFINFDWQHGKGVVFPPPPAP